MRPRRLILVKHALPVLDDSVPACEWRLGQAGEQQARALAATLRRFIPFRLLTSIEPKARRTGEIVAGELGISFDTAEGLHEIDRPVLPIWSREEHQRANAAIFTDMERPVLGAESGREALERFDRTVRSELERTEGDLAVVAHGTVIALFAGHHDPAVDAFELWKGLECGALVVLAVPGFLRIAEP